MSQAASKSQMKQTPPFRPLNEYTLRRLPDEIGGNTRKAEFCFTADQSGHASGLLAQRKPMHDSSLDLLLPDAALD